MSEKSKRRLLALLNTLRRDAPLPIMLTVEFPEELTVSAQEAKRCYLALAKRLEREHGDRWSALWRVEAHPEMSKRLGRVCPHLHILCWNIWFDLDGLSRDWAEVCLAVLGYDDQLCDAEGRRVFEKHVAAGTSAERVKKWEGVAYMVKQYMAKEEEYPLGKAGRVWGWWKFDRLPIAPVRREVLTPRQVVIVQKRVREWMAARGLNGEYALRSLFCEDPSALAARLLAPESANETEWLARQWSWRGGPKVET